MDFSLADLRTVGFNDVISSFENCQTVLFEDINFGGATTQKAKESSNVGLAMNDRASSIRLFQDPGTTVRAFAVDVAGSRVR